MNYLLAQIVVAVGSNEEESAFWMQMLALVVLAALLGVGGLVRARMVRSRYAGQSHTRSFQGPYVLRRWTTESLKILRDKCLGVLSRGAGAGAVVEQAATGFEDADTAAAEGQRKASAKARDLAGGMELLRVDFLVGIVENPNGEGQRDVVMQKLSFNELVRRGKLSAVESDTLKAYAMNELRLYDKDIQCEAMKELAQRTIVRSS
jgi:hypothetical protein